MKVKLGSLKVQSFVTSLPQREAKAEGGLGDDNPPLTIVEDASTVSMGQSRECSYGPNCTYMTGCSLYTCQQTCGWTGWGGCWC
jgi:hypothetical protein